MKKRGGLGWGFKEGGQQGANSRPDLQTGKLSPRELKGLDLCSQISQFLERSQIPEYRHLPLLKLPAPNKKHVWDRHDPRAARGSPLTWKSPDTLPSWKQLFGKMTFAIHTNVPPSTPPPHLATWSRLWENRAPPSSLPSNLFSHSALSPAALGPANLAPPLPRKACSV